MSQSPFATTAPAMIAGGYSVVPIGAWGEHDWNPKGKEPGRLDVNRDGEPEWFRLKGWDAFCDRQAHPATVAYWSTWPDAGVGLACGFGGVVAVDIDRDDLIEPLLAVLPPVLVAKKGRKGLTAFYRTSETLPSKNYRTTNKIGLCDFLAGGKQTVLPPTVHPDTGLPYEWITESTLFNTALAALPEITNAHVEAMEEVLRARGWEAPNLAERRGEAVERPTRSHGALAGDIEFDRAVTTARGQWLPLLGLHGLRRVSGGWRAVASFRASGSGSPLHKRGLSLSIRDTGEIVDHGGEKHNNITLVAACLFSDDNTKAFAWLREQISWTDAPDPVSVAQATYQDNRVSLEDATARLQMITGPEFANAILNGIAVKNQAALKPPLMVPVHPVTVVRSEAGVGKTRAVIENAAKQARLGRRIDYVVPRHDLAEQIAADFALLGVKAEVYRGYERPDPLAPDHAMCRNRPAYEVARDLGVSIRDSICERRIDNETIRCPLANVCGMERQREARPSVWVIPAALMHLKRPDFFFTPDAVVIDESFIDGAIGDTVQIDVTALLAAKIEGCSNEEHDEVERFRYRLAAAIKANSDGPLSRAALIEHGITAEIAYDLGWLEQRCVDARRLRPDMKPGELKTVAYRHAARNKLARDAGALWHEIATFLEEWKVEAIIGDRSQSGRITVAGGKVSMTPLRAVHPSWRDAPTLALDATAPPASLIAIALGEIEQPGLPPVVTEEPDVVAKWPDHVRVRQIIGAPVSMGKLGLWDKPKPRNVRDIVRHIRLQAALAAPDRIGVITYKGVLEQIEGQLPGNVVARHFGALAGMNDMQDVAGLIVIGRPAPKRSSIEATASIFAGRPVSGGEGHFFDQHPGGIPLADGSVISAMVDYHTEPIAEALRWRVTVGELLQAVGRLRPHRRSEPCWLDIVCDVPLPIPMHKLVRWEDVAPGAVGDMTAGGVVLTNSRDAMTAFGLSDWETRGVGGFSIESLIRHSTDSSPGRKFSYQKAGPGQKRYTGYYLPGVLPGGVSALRTWLEAKFGPLASLDVERVGARNTKRGEAMLKKGRGYTRNRACQLIFQRRRMR